LGGHTMDMRRRPDVARAAMVQGMAEAARVAEFAAQAGSSAR